MPAAEKRQRLLGGKVHRLYERALTFLEEHDGGCVSLREDRCALEHTGEHFVQI